MDHLEMRPRTLGDLFSLVLRLSLALFVPLFAMAMVPQLFNIAGQLVDPALGGLLVLVSAILGQCVVGASVMLIAGRFLPERVSLSDSISVGLRSVIFVIFASILMGIGIVLGMFALILPGIALAVLWFVTIPALVVERLGPVAALKRSFGLVKQRFWPVLGTLMVFVAIFFVAWIAVVAVAVATTMATGGMPDPDEPSLPVIVVTSLVIAALTVPISVLQVAIYFDLRARFDEVDSEFLSSLVARVGRRSARSA